MGIRHSDTQIKTSKLHTSDKVIKTLLDKARDVILSRSNDTCGYNTEVGIQEILELENYLAFLLETDTISEGDTEFVAEEITEQPFIYRMEE